MRLTREECERLGDWWDDSDAHDWGLPTLIPVVEELVRQRMAQVWDEANRATYEVERDSGDGSEVPNPYRDDENGGEAA